MKILFVYPNAGSQLGFNYGVAHLAGVLKAAGHEVILQQLCEDLGPLPTKDEFQAELRRTKPDLIGFSVVTTQWPYARELAEWAREVVDVPRVCGGIHAMVAADEVLRSGAFDYILIGECEDAMAEFAARLEAGDPVTDCRNLGYVEDGKVVLNPVRPLPDLAALPPKDYSIFPFQQIINAKHGWVGLMASRGCPFNCSYCFNHIMVRRYREDLDCGFKGLNYIRHFPVDRMIDEIQELLATYSNISMFILDDDLFTYDCEYVREFCRRYAEITDIPFVVNGHVGFFDEERAAALTAANCRIVKFGVESGSPRIRRQVMNRSTGNEKITQAIRIVKDAGMHSSCFLMIGLPHETQEDLMATVNLMARSVPGRFRWTFFYPFPGTESYEIARRGGYIDTDAMTQLSNFTDGTCLDFGEEQNLLLEKVGLVMPWFVNAASDLPCSAVYQEKIDWLLGLSRSEWEKVSEGLLEEDKELSAAMIKAGHSHYAIKYNRFMGVISDYFLNES